MKKRMLFIVFICLLSFSSTMDAQKYINVELLGINGLAGVSFDGRFEKHSKFGYEIGLGYGFVKEENNSRIAFATNSLRPFENGIHRVFSLPVNVHYLIGKERHFLETGIGINLMFTDYEFRNYAKAGYLSFGRVAYRYEAARNPLLIAAGVDVTFHGNYSFGIIPAFTIGYRL